MLNKKGYYGNEVIQLKDPKSGRRDTTISQFCVRIHLLAISCFWEIVEVFLKPVEALVVEMLIGATYSPKLYVWLDGVHALLQNTHLGLIGQQMLYVLIQRTDIIIVNLLMTHAEMCHPATGLRLKQITAEAKEWAILHAMPQATFQNTDPLMTTIMLHSVEAANVLLMDKLVFLNRDVLSTFAALGPAQIARLLNFFNPDDVSGERLPLKVAQQVSQWSQQHTKYHLNLAKNLP